MPDPFAGLATDNRFGAFTAAAPATPVGHGPLAGLRVAVKDLIAVAGLPTNGDLGSGGGVADRDAACVDSLRAAGASIVGVTRSDAGGFGTLTRAVVNPRAQDRIAGGSSGGSAAAVAGDLADAALGTDTGGSVRIPAACCGVYGFKPTTGRIPLDGVQVLSGSMDTVGLMAADPDPLGRIAETLLDDRDTTRTDALARPRVMYDPAGLEHVEAQVRTAVEHAISHLAGDGAGNAIAVLPHPTDVLGAHGAIVCAEAAARHGVAYRQAPNDFPRAAATAFEKARTLTHAELAAARAMRSRAEAVVDALLDTDDAVLAIPTLPWPAPHRDTRLVLLDGKSVPLPLAMMWFTALFNMTGHPALALPLPVGAAGASLQLIGRRGADRALLALAVRFAHGATPTRAAW